MDEVKDLWGDPLKMAHGDGGPGSPAKPTGNDEASTEQRPRLAVPCADGKPARGEAMVVVANVLESTAAQPDAVIREREMIQAMLYLASRIDMLGKCVESGSLAVANTAAEAPSNSLPHVEPAAEGQAATSARGSGTERDPGRARRVKTALLWIAIALAFAAGLALFVAGGGLSAQFALG